MDSKQLFESGPGAYLKGEFKEGSLIPGESLKDW